MMSLGAGVPSKVCASLRVHPAASRAEARLNLNAVLRFGKDHASIFEVHVFAGVDYTITYHRNATRVDSYC